MDEIEKLEKEIKELDKNEPYGKSKVALCYGLKAKKYFAIQDKEVKE